MSAAFSIILVGCGNMGSAMLRSWLDSDISANFTVIDPNVKGLPVKTYKTIDDASEALKTADMLILAVKPQIMADICTQLAAHINSTTAILSIAAGQSLQSLAEYFGSAQPVIRTMPNLPASIQKGMTVAIANTHVPASKKERADMLLKCTGTTEWVEDESLLDAVTALSGSGPAYIFHLIETLASAGEKQGLSSELSMALARQTVIGSAALVESSPDTPAQTLRENVTSPGGTTAAALEILMNGELQDLYDQAIAAATQRGKELNN